MKRLLEKLFKKGLSDPTLIELVDSKKTEKELIEWERKGRPAPPPHVIKQRELRNYADKYDLKVLVETGTFMGDMVEAMKNSFEKIYSIELSAELYENARKRFEGDERIELIHGDSGKMLGKLLENLDQPALFWLDGHYSAGITAKGEKETPIYEELTHIYSAQISGHVVLIDDARCFGTDPAYPSTSELSEFIRTKRPDSKIEVDFDSIRVTQPS